MELFNLLLLQHICHSTENRKSQKGLSIQYRRSIRLCQLFFFFFFSMLVKEIFPDQHLFISIVMRFMRCNQNHEPYLSLLIIQHTHTHTKLQNRKSIQKGKKHKETKLQDHRQRASKFDQKLQRHGESQPIQFSQHPHRTEPSSSHPQDNPLPPFSQKTLAFLNFVNFSIKKRRQARRIRICIYSICSKRKG